MKVIIVADSTDLLTTLDDWLYFLENRHTQEIQLGLDRIKQVAERLNLLNFDAKIITIAGTNGKGSTVAALESIYDSAGYKVGSYTSPHLLKFNERIRKNLIPISDEMLCQAFNQLEAQRCDIHLTYFEMATLAALWYFKQFDLDIILLEVGLGGRLDATNIIDADVTIITTIDLDHMSILGNTKEKIGFEKAGIMRAQKPCIYADNDPPNSILEKAASLNVPIMVHNQDFFLTANANDLQIVSQSFGQINLPRPAINLKCAGAAVMATKWLDDMLPVSERHIKKAMQTVYAEGRQSVIEGKITTVLDVAHNPQAANLLAKFISQRNPSGHVHAVFAALNDKDLCKMINAMCEQVDYWYPAGLDSKRAATKYDMQQAFIRSKQPMSDYFATPSDAYAHVLKCAEPGDLIVVFGSFLTVSCLSGFFDNTHSIQQENNA